MLQRDYEPIREWAERQGMTVDAAYRAVERGHLPVLRIGRRVYVDLRALEAIRHRELSRLAERAGRSV